jgi:glycosyltransferase involved in cell wall biosynthesis
MSPDHRALASHPADSDDVDGAERVEPIRLLRIIARLNIGGPAIQAISLTRLLAARGYTTRLVRGSEGPDEGSMDDLAQALDVTPTLVGSMRREPGPGDLKALWQVMRIIRRDRPEIIHTHAAKGGTIGRAAALLATTRRNRPILVHTFHGHSLSGYFASRTARFYRRIERCLARRTDALIAVSAEVRDDLVRLGVAASERFTVVPVGLDLSAFLDDADRPRRRAALRQEWNCATDDEVITLVARLVPIKRVDRFLRVARMLADRPRARFVVVGDGELRDQLAASDDARALGDRLVWAGFRRDMADVCFAADVVVLTSDNEGTPVSLIEAQAAAVPVVGTAVGGVASAVRDGETGIVAPVGDEAALARAIAAILDDGVLAARLGQAGRVHASSAFAVERLVDDLDRLYHQLLVESRRSADRRSSQ